MIDLCISEKGNWVKGPGMWKMNVSLLDDENYLNADLEQLVYQSGNKKVRNRVW